MDDATAGLTELLNYSTDMNINEQIPFSDSLIEYLIGNAITGEEEISDNILRAQKVIAAEVNKDKKEDEYHYTIDNEGI